VRVPNAGIRDLTGGSVGFTKPGIGSTAGKIAFW
jgi:hypothetical protein